MKKTIFKIALLMFTVSFVGCKQTDNAIYEVFDNVSYGAILRTLDNGSNRTFSITDLNSKFIVEFEEQDEQGGALLDKVNVWLSFADNTPGGVDNSKDDTLYKAVMASEFTTSERDLPQTSLEISFGEAINALGLNAGEYDGGDVFTVRLELVLTDGRTFSAADAGGSLQGSYFQSPYAYTSLIICPFVAGDYVINMRDTYGDGWQGSEVVCTIDGVEIKASLLSQYAPGGVPISAGTQTITIPATATTVEWSFVAGDWPSEVEFDVIGPNSGTVIGAFANPSEGPLNLNYCGE